MKRIALVAAVIALAACSGSEEAPAIDTSAAMAPAPAAMDTGMQMMDTAAMMMDTTAMMDTTKR